MYTEQYGDDFSTVILKAIDLGIMCQCEYCSCACFTQPVLGAFISGSIRSTLGKRVVYHGDADNLTQSVHTSSANADGPASSPSGIRQSKCKPCTQGLILGQLACSQVVSTQRYLWGNKFNNYYEHSHMRELVDSKRLR